MISLFDECLTPAENISRTSASAANVGRYASDLDITKLSSTYDDAKGNSYVDRTPLKLFIPSLPLERARPDSLHPNAPAKIYVGNIAFDADEWDIVEFFNSVGGAFEHRCTALTAVNLPYRRDHAGLQIFQGQGFFIYGTPELAAFALRTLNGRTFRGRALRVEMSRHPLDCKATNGANIRGQSRWGDNIFECPPPP